MAIPTALVNFERSIKDDIAAIVSDQDVYVRKGGKFKQIRKSESAISGLAVTEYVGALGSGYVVELEQTIGNQLWRKWLDYGLEERSQEWFRVR